MRRLFLGSLVVATLAASSSAFAVEAGSTPGADNAPAPTGKQTKSTKPKRTAIPLSAAYDSRSNELPAASIHTSSPPPAQPLWSGTYVGVGAGK